jgi:hypothetical protein
MRKSIVRWRLWGSSIQPEEGSFHQLTGLNLRNELVKCCIWVIALYGAETWILSKGYQKYLESFEMWCWRRMEKISWTDRVRNSEVLRTVKEARNILQTIKRRKAN